MVRVSKWGDLHLKVETNYSPSYARRLGSIPGSRFEKHPKPRWIVPLVMMDHLEGLFAGELLWITPRHEILGEPPPVEAWYDDIVMRPMPSMKQSLFNFQQFGASFLLQRSQEQGFAFLCDDTGIGKSPQALAAAQLLREADKAERILIVSPASVRHQWVVDAIPKFLGNIETLEITSKPRKRRHPLYEQVAPITVVNYELFREDIEVILKQKWDLVIWDECQYVRTNTGVTHRAAKRLSRRVPYQFFLTASVLMHDLEDLHALLSIGDRTFLGTVTEFRKSYIEYDYSGFFPRLVGYRNLDELRTRVAPLILRRTDKDPEVAKHLPEVVIQNHYVEMNKQQRELYEYLEPAYEEAKAELRSAWESKDKERIKRADNWCKGMIMLLQGAADTPRLFTMSTSKMVDPYRHLCEGADPTPKMKLIKDVVTDFAAKGEKILLFTQFERMAQLMHEYLTDFNPAFFAGTNRKTRDDEKTRFLNDPDCMCMVSTDAGGVGLNLQVARCEINIDLPWLAGQVDQRKGRIRRFGATHRKVVVINVITRDTIDEQILSANEQRESLYRTVIPEYAQAELKEA